MLGLAACDEPRKPVPIERMTDADIDSMCNDKKIAFGVALKNIALGEVIKKQCMADLRQKRTAAQKKPKTIAPRSRLP